MGGPRDLEGLFDVFLEVCNERKSGRSGVPLRERLDQFLGSLGNVPLGGTIAKAPKRINRENLKKVIIIEFQVIIMRYSQNKQWNINTGIIRWLL